ncbi:hypothetical protein [Terracoccus luteus]|uniref:Uncharacterized protein n=1 Tax=Terracoccus luteus TaxID=53356 RepID=A0A839PXP1_9MICO|nr:hypothetical protein [Terracoccus luteus]MBB2988139.1 hypothetical protein [Terracoccus luteus]MCP2173774.1 hypothetical protein [Terracoccus luteus]
MTDHVHVTETSRPVTAPESSLRAPECLAALYRILWDHDMFAKLASNFSTWSQLASESYT